MGNLANQINCKLQITNNWFGLCFDYYKFNQNLIFCNL